MNDHLSQEELILRYYGEPELGSRGDHVDACEVCRAELVRLAAVLDRVTPDAIPEPDDDYESRVWNRLSWRLRAEKKRAAAPWMKWLAVAAVVAMAFTGGLLWNRRAGGPAMPAAPQQVNAATAPDALPAAAATPAPAGSQETPAGTIAVASRESSAAPAPPRDRILLFVVSEHFDQSERMLIELTNLTPADGEGFDITTERVRAEELLASNRIYRRTAVERGEGNVATLLDELEPVLLQIAHAPESMTAEELRTIQERVEAKGLVFKLRVVRAGVSRKSAPRTAPTT